MKNSRSVTVSMVLNYIFCLCVIGLCFIMPKITQNFFDGQNSESYVWVTVTVTYYICVPGALFSTYLLSALLRSIRKKDVFTMTNILRLRLLSWCCAYISLVSFFAGIIYFPMLIISFAVLFMCIILRVIKNVFAYAVEINRENELTV